MANIEIRGVENLAGTAVPYAYAVKAGPWLFLTGHEAFDFAAGPAPEVEGPAGFPSFGAPRLKREAEYILKRMRKTLAEFGSDFRHSVRVDQYYPVFEAVRAYQLARHGEFGDYIPPSTSVLMKRLFKANSHISMSMIAVVPGKDYEIGKLYPKEVPVPVGSFFVPAITCNDFVFVAGQMASDENALDPSVRLPKESAQLGRPQRRAPPDRVHHQEAPRAGPKGRRLVVAEHPQGADLRPDGGRHSRRARRLAAARAAHTPARSPPCRRTASASSTGSSRSTCSRCATARSAGKRCSSPTCPRCRSYGAVVRAGELVFPSGFMPIGFDSSDPFDGLARASQVQALAVLGFADKVCRAAGTTLQNIVRAQWFMADATQFPGVELAWMGRQGKQPHPFVCVQVPAPLPAPGATLTADFWIYAP